MLAKQPDALAFKTPIANIKIIENIFEINMGYKMKKATQTDWYHLALVERGSGIEVLSVAHKFEDGNLQKKILDHALDEYRHAEYFVEIGRYQKEEEIQVGSATLIYAGGLGAVSKYSSTSTEDMTLLLEEGEHRAIRALDQLLKIHDDPYVVERLVRIREDEVGHADGVRRFNRKLSYQYKLKLASLHFGFYKNDLIVNLSRKAIPIKMTKLFFRMMSKLPLHLIADIDSKLLNKKSAFQSSRSMV